MLYHTVYSTVMLYILASNPDESVFKLLWCKYTHIYALLLFLLNWLARLTIFFFFFQVNIVKNKLSLLKLPRTVLCQVFFDLIPDCELMLSEENKNIILCRKCTVCRNNSWFWLQAPQTAIDKRCLLQKLYCKLLYWHVLNSFFSTIDCFNPHLAEGKPSLNLIISAIRLPLLNIGLPFRLL